MTAPDKLRESGRTVAARHRAPLSPHPYSRFPQKPRHLLASYDNYVRYTRLHPVRETPTGIIGELHGEFFRIDVIRRPLQN